MAHKMQQYTCPECGTCGANRISSQPPLCHKCNYEVTMMKSLNGKIIIKKSKEDITTEAREFVASKMSYEYENYIMEHLAGDFAYALSCLLKAKDKQNKNFIDYLNSIENKVLEIKALTEGKNII